MSTSVPEHDTSSADSIPVSRIIETRAAVAATGHEAEHGHEERESPPLSVLPESIPIRFCLVLRSLSPGQNIPSLVPS